MRYKPGMRRIDLFFAALPFAVVAAVACAPGGTGSSDCLGEVPSYSTEMFAKCTSCHSADSTARNGAPAAVNYDTYEEAKKNAARGATRVEQGTMPPASAEELTEEEHAAIVAWARCGTPE